MGELVDNLYWATDKLKKAWEGRPEECGNDPGPDDCPVCFSLMCVREDLQHLLELAKTGNHG